LIWAALLLAAGRLIVLRIASRRVMGAARLTYLTLLSLLFISVVWHFYSSPVLVIKILGWVGINPQPACD
jgi:hypothetical protein